MVAAPQLDGPVDPKGSDCPSENQLNCQIDTSTQYYSISTVVTSGPADVIPILMSLMLIVGLTTGPSQNQVATEIDSINHPALHNYGIFFTGSQNLTYLASFTRVSMCCVCSMKVTHRSHRNSFVYPVGSSSARRYALRVWISQFWWEDAWAAVGIRVVRTR